MLYPLKSLDYQSNPNFPLDAVIHFGRPKLESLTPKYHHGSLKPNKPEGILRMQGDGSASKIASDLAAEVHDGKLQPGEMYPSERDLCERYSVGRSIVRDGMTILQGMGLADHSKGKRPRVAKPTLSRLMVSVSGAAQMFFTDNEGRAHLEQARLFLETSMLRYAVEHATHAQIAKMVSAIEECDANLGDIAAFRLADVKFHRALAEVPGNPVFVALHETFVEQMMKGQPEYKDFEKRNLTSNAGHKDIMAALLAKDADTAVQALTLHLSRNYGSNFQQSLSNRLLEIT